MVRYLAALSHAMTIAVNEWGWLDDSPLRKVTKPKEPRGRVRFLSDEERVSLLIACKESQNPYLFTVVVMALAPRPRNVLLRHIFLITSGCTVSPIVGTGRCINIGGREPLSTRTGLAA